MSETSQAVAKDITWLKQHERLILGLSLLFLVFFLGNKFLNWRTTRDIRQEAVAEKTLTDQKKQNKSFADDSATQAQQNIQLLRVVTLEIQKLEGAIQARDTAVHEQQVKDQTLPLTDLVNRWELLVPLPPGDVQASPTGATVDDNGVRKTVSQLEQIPALVADVNDKKAIVTDREKQLDSADTLIADQNKQIGGLVVQIADADKTCQAQIKLVKDEAAKSKKNWMLIGGALVLIAHAVIHAGVL
ncbi:MAG: hypothetical protein JWQ87_2029 [Candidatus Sulfotelmatobacter sp.]|nr:hypothetical protein [Candidatus Sulfotelmatobacter sp.]